MAEKTKRLTKKLCPRCQHYSVYNSGRVRVGPRKGYRTVYYCSRCGYRWIG